MKKEVYYSEYLKLESILQAQELESVKNQHPAHDEMLFIVTHQTLELWMKQIHFEIDSILQEFAKPYLPDATLSVIHHRLQRIVEIQKLMTSHFTVLETMTPLDFLDFRDDLIPASGFQSLQFKQLECKLGIYQRHQSSTKAYSQQSLHKEDQSRIDENTMTLFQGVQTWLERNPFLESKEYQFESSYKNALDLMFEKEKTLIQNHPFLDDEQRKKETVNVELMKDKFKDLFESENGDATQGKLSRKALLSALFINLYRDYPMIHTPFQVLRSLIELDQMHVAWKHKHLSMVRKMIGLKMGTGGSSGQKYLSESIEASSIFSDLVSLPSYLVSRQNIPVLPESISKQLGFRWV